MRFGNIPWVARLLRQICTFTCSWLLEIGNVQDLKGLAAISSTLATAEVDPPPQISTLQSAALLHDANPSPSHKDPLHAVGSSYGQGTTTFVSGPLDVDAGRSMVGAVDDSLKIGSLQSSKTGSLEQCGMLLMEELSTKPLLSIVRPFGPWNNSWPNLWAMSGLLKLHSCGESSHKGDAHYE